MSYNKNSLVTVGQLQKTARKSKEEDNALNLALDILEARMDTQVIASTDSDADYAAEVVDSRIDIWANSNPSLGVNIRDSQARLTHGLQQIQTSHQEQIDSLGETILSQSTAVSKALDSRRSELLEEKESRIESFENLQTQLNSNSNTILKLCCELSKIRDLIRN